MPIALRSDGTRMVQRSAYPCVSDEVFLEIGYFVRHPTETNGVLVVSEKPTDAEEYQVSSSPDGPFEDDQEEDDDKDEDKSEDDDDEDEPQDLPVITANKGKGKAAPPKIPSSLLSSPPSQGGPGHTTRHSAAAAKTAAHSSVLESTAAAAGLSTRSTRARRGLAGPPTDGDTADDNDGSPCILGFAQSLSVLSAIITSDTRGDALPQGAAGRPKRARGVEPPSSPPKPKRNRGGA
ncbi:hypothetical protein SISNIDRAFT_488133 [Sistotremastrum niveocremeum HHB9708]|uniref:Uncharacterized protein n=1 Tax=Sistotremastrum niveocremeum HHB9708 TaxID=1314777 RepID=A0A164RH35_9AGAM|nr:hypothetical protein SISNIDRAFT_488133 [Sistotremastrum niveocremeum HHB9708]